MTSTPEAPESAEPALEAEIAADVVVTEADAVAEADVSVDEATDAIPVDAPAPPVHDAALLEAHDLALSALREITAPSSIGDAAGYTLEADGVVSLRFSNRLAGYPGWFWTVSLARVGGAEPTVLEVELLPGDGALLAPEWTPWAVRLAEYQAAQVALAEAASADADGDEDDESDEDDDDFEDDDDEDDDVTDLDASEFDEDGSSILHAGDVDGVDIDSLDEDADDLDEDADDLDQDADDLDED